MIIKKYRWILVLLILLGLVFAAQAAKQVKTYLPVILDNHVAETPQPSPTETPTPTSTTTVTTEPSPSATQTESPFPTVQVNTLFEIEMDGPASVGMGDPNPFLIEVDLTFTGPQGQQLTVPGFYDGDGIGGLDGSTWKARFTPENIGVWSYTSSSPEPLLDGYVGAFNAVNPSNCEQYIPGGLPDFTCLGRLEYAGNHYLRFANGQYWLKGGVNDPEAFLLEGVTAGFTTKEAAIDFLADNGVNSLYMLFHGVWGDNWDLYPWVGDNGGEALTNNERYDVEKLAEWKGIFDYLQDKGLVLHLVFEDDNVWDDDAWSGFNRQLYYREMIARFGHYNGLIWNIAEEYSESYPGPPLGDDIKGFAQMIKDLDAYDHPLTVHQVGPLTTWDPFLGDSRFDLTSFQSPIDPMNGHNINAVDWFGITEDSGRTIPVSFDEIRYFDSFDTAKARHVAWALYMGGAYYELRIYPDTDYSPLEPHMIELQTAREFIERLPFWQMEPDNDLLVSGAGYVFAKPGEVYSVYLHSGGQIGIDLSGTGATYNAQWFNPRNGAYQAIGVISGGGTPLFDAPSAEDWVLLLEVSPPP